MALFHTTSEVEKLRNSASLATVGLVPTMGALHQGHLELIRRACAENTETWVSIFVNPTQFNKQDDLVKYPTALEKDLSAIHTIDPSIHVFAPTVGEMYPEEIVAKLYAFDGLDRVMEGLDRPGHFDGVITIVAKLFELIKPTRAYFGEKDFQQLQIIKNWAAKEHIPTTIVPCPIVREANGLAMSSRNEQLSKQARNEAGFIHKTMFQCVDQCQTKKELYACIHAAFATKPTFELLYAICVEEDSLKEVDVLALAKKPRLFVASSIEGVRLIDNIALK
jgi:pantoate--beta-alanine ligase